MRNWIILAAALFLAGCSSTNRVLFEVTSEPPNAPVEVNGYGMGRTPTTIELECKKSWVGYLNSPDGYSRSGPVQVTAFPPEGAGGDSQTKTIDPCSWKGEGNPSIFFDLTLKHVEPVERIEAKISEIPTEKEGDSERDKLIAALRELRDAGALTQEEYEQKVLEILEKEEK